MTTVAVIAHSGKTFGGGLGELRRVLDDAGFPQPLWYEVAKNRQAPQSARQAREEGADASAGRPTCTPGRRTSAPAR